MKKKLLALTLVFVFIVSELSVLLPTVRGASVTLTVSSAHGSPSPSVGSYSYDSGTSVTCSVSSPITESSTVWTCTGWTGTGSVPPSGTGTSTTFAITVTSSITWNWEISGSLSNGYVTPTSGTTSDTFYYYVTYYDSFGANALSPTVVTDSGSGYMGIYQGSGSNGVYRYWTTLPVGSNHWYYFRFTSGSSGATIWLPPLPYAYNGPTVTPPIQRQLIVNTAHDTGNPPNGVWHFNDGQSIICTVTSPVTESGTVWTCTSWTGTGSVPQSGTGASTGYFTITQDSSITWNWQGSAVQRTLTVSSAHDSPVPNNGPHTYSDSSSVTCSVTSPVTEGNTVWTCIGWTGTGSVPSSGTDQTVTFTITQDSTITWTWQEPGVQHTLTVNSAHDSPYPGNGPNLYSDGQQVVCSVTSPVTEMFTTWYCIGWTGTGSVPSSGSDTWVGFTMTQDSSITWKWISSTQDSDGDGLPDVWEIFGVDSNNDGIIDLNLQTLGANPNHKDLFLEVDYMGSDGTHDHRPDPNAVTDVINAFSNAPVTNPDGINGTALHVQVDDEIPHHDTMNLYISLQYPWTDFDSNKTEYFGTSAERCDANSVNILAAKRMVFRYCLFIHQYATWDISHGWVTTTSSGIAELPGNDFTVSLGAFTNNRGSRDEQAGTLMHELGHTLGLRHGGGDDVNGKPNYLSIMSYSRQFSTPSGWIQNRPLDYSRSQLPGINEANLDETAGIGGPMGDQTVFGPSDPQTGTFFLASSQGPIDWNRNGLQTDKGVVRSINDFTSLNVPFGDSTLSVLTGYDDWTNLLYDFRSTAGYADGAHPETANTEITWEMVEEMKEHAPCYNYVLVGDIIGQTPPNERRVCRDGRGYLHISIGGKYAKSIDVGKTWNVTDMVSGPISCDGDNVVISYVNDSFFFIAISFDNGCNWIFANTTKTIPAEYIETTDIVIRGSRIYYLFKHYIYTFNNSEVGVWFFSSSDFGSTWSEPVNILPQGNNYDGGGIYQIYPSNLVVEGNGGDSDIICVAGTGNALYMQDVFFRKSVDSGLTWGPLLKIVNYGVYGASSATMTRFASNVYLAWYEGDHIRYMDSNDGGDSWSYIQTLDTTGNVGPPIITEVGGRPLVLWTNSVLYSSENVVYRVFNGNWSDESYITNDTDRNIWVSTGYRSNNIDLIWTKYNYGYLCYGRIVLTNFPPDKPTNPNPPDGFTDAHISITLSVDVSDPDGDPMNVSFYDAASFTLIGTNYNIGNGTRTSVQWVGLTPSTTYRWYVVADDAKGGTTQSDIWAFYTETSPRMIIVPDDLPTIQQAVNAANQGDTVFVKAGIYYENVVVTKALSLIGEDVQSTIIDGGGIGDVVVYIVADGVNVTGFTLQNSAYGFEFSSSSHCTIAGNRVTATILGNGIALFYGSDYNIISGNNITGGQIGIFLRYSCEYNTIVGNEITHNNPWGIGFMDGSDYNRICHNSFVDNPLQVHSNMPNNAWDGGYPSGGNYWSDYSGTDVFSGRYQNESGNDGIGDTPYVIDASNQDNYPLMHPYGSIQNLNTSLVYLTIQSAIDAPQTEDGHTIFVRNGTYYENVVVNKSVSLAGENRNTTIIDGGGTGTVVYVTDTRVSIIGFTIRNSPHEFPYPGGIYLDHSWDSYIADNIITYPGAPGIFLDFSSNNTLANNMIIDSYEGIHLLNSPNNMLIDNEVARNHFGIRLYWSPSNKLFNNVIVDSIYWGIELYGSSDNVIIGNVICHNDFVNMRGQAAVSLGSVNTWDDGYPPGGNYWSDYTGVDIRKGPTQDQPGSDNIGDTPYVIDTNNVDHYPWMNLSGSPLAPTYSLTITASSGGTTNPPPGNHTYSQGQTVPVQAAPNIGYVFDHWELDGVNRTENPINVTMDQDHTLHAVFMIHDVAVTDVRPSKTVVGLGYNMNMNVTVANQGDYTETFNVTTYVTPPPLPLEIVIDITTVNLDAGQNMTISLAWNTAGLDIGNWTVRATAGPVSEETNTTDNTFSVVVKVTIPGDLNGDFKVSLADLVLLANAYGSKPGDAKWNPNADINSNNAVDLSDLVLMATHYGQQV